VKILTHQRPHCELEDNVGNRSAKCGGVSSSNGLRLQGRLLKEDN
jgi:hypothetical protein